MEFNTNNEIKNFVKELKNQLTSVGENKLLRELINWEDTFFTSSSEFLGELKLILEQIQAQNILSFKDKTQNQIADCIKSINKAFGI